MTPRQVAQSRLVAAHLVLMAAVVVPARAAEAPVDTSFTVEEAIRFARRHNEVPRLARARIAQARAAREEAWGLLLPSFSIGGTYRRRSREIARQVGDVRAIVQRRDGLATSANVEMRILDPAAIPTVRASRYALDAAKYDGETLERELWLEVAESYFGILSAERVREAAERRIEVAELSFESARRRFEAGLVGRNDVTRTELELASARLARTQSERAVRIARLTLEHLMGAPIPAPLVDPEAPLVEALGERALLERAQRVRTEILGQAARVEGARILAREPKLRAAPRLDASAFSSWTNEPGIRGIPFDWGAAVTATWVLYDGARRGAIHRTEGAGDEQRALLDQLRREVAMEVRTALLDLESASDAVSEASLRVEVAQKNEVEVRARFDRGLADALVQADAVQSTFEAEAELARQRFAQRVAEIDLLRAVGEWPGRENR